MATSLTSYMKKKTFQITESNKSVYFFNLKEFSNSFRLRKKISIIKIFKILSLLLKEGGLYYIGGAYILVLIGN